MAQISLAQIGPAQISAPEARPDQIRPGQVGTDLRVVAPPLVPSHHPLLEPCDMRPVGHERSSPWLRFLSNGQARGDDGQSMDRERPKLGRTAACLRVSRAKKNPSGNGPETIACDKSGA